MTHEEYVALLSETLTRNWLNLSVQDATITLSNGEHFTTVAVLHRVASAVAEEGTVITKLPDNTYMMWNFEDDIIDDQTSLAPYALNAIELVQVEPYSTSQHGIQYRPC